MRMSSLVDLTLPLLYNKQQPRSMAYYEGLKLNLAVECSGKLEFANPSSGDCVVKIVMQWVDIDTAVRPKWKKQAKEDKR
jgi:hypothetical protein